MILSIETAGPYLSDKKVWAIQSPVKDIPKSREKELVQVLEQALLKNHVEYVVHVPHGIFSVALMKATIKTNIDTHLYHLVQNQSPIPIPGHQIVVPNPNFWDLELELLLLWASEYVGEAHIDARALGYPAQALWRL